jgi:Ca2+-binding EF-hand superfamily protein
MLETVDSGVEAIRSLARRSMDVNSRPTPYRYQPEAGQQKPQQIRHISPQPAVEQSKGGRQRNRTADGTAQQKRNDLADSLPEQGATASDAMVDSLRHAISSMDVTASERKQQKHMFLRGDKSRKQMLRAEDMKSYVAAFQGISVADNGTVQLEDFMKHVNEASPKLADHAMSMYENLVRKSKNDDGSVDAGAMLRVLFPGICDEDVRNIIEMCKAKPRQTEEQIRQEHMLKLLDEAKELFRVLDTKDSGFLSRADAIEATRSGLLDMTDVDMEEVFGKRGTSTDRPFVAFDVFFEWYSASDLTSIIADA